MHFEQLQVAKANNTLILVQLEEGKHYIYSVENGVQYKKEAQDIEIVSGIFSLPDFYEGEEGMQFDEHGKYPDPEDRVSGWYLCEIDYDMIQFIYYWDHALQRFYANGDQAPLIEQESYEYISRQPLDLKKLCNDHPINSISKGAKLSWN